MSITYTWGSPVVRPRKESEHIEGGARGLMTKDRVKEIINRQLPTPHVVIQIKQGAYTEEEWAALANTIDGKPTGTHSINVNDYGVKWRAWVGDPTTEQLEMPWEEAGGENG